MPEMPEVESLRRFLAQRVIGRAITRIDIVAINALKTFDPSPETLYGLSVRAVGRHGKFLDIDAGQAHLVIHLARAGWLRWSDDLPAIPPRPGKGPLAARIHLDDGSGFDLTEAGTQKRLAIHVVSDPQQVGGIRTLGPDPTEDSFGRDELHGVLDSAGRARLKGVLRDQHVLAGIGNAYSDEILHAAKLSPFKAADSLTSDEFEALFTAIKGRLAEAVDRAQGLAAKDLKKEKKVAMRVHGRTGRPCPVCGDTILEVSYADWSMQYCPTCQTGGKPLADRRMSRLLK
jgi:formamidopyrimidine-DNA glycosylase